MPHRRKTKPAESHQSVEPRVALPASRWLRFAILGLATLLLVACFSPAFQDHDSWWHLKTGQFILQQHRLPTPDPFAYTTYLGRPSYPGEAETRYFNLTHEWLAQLILYLVYAAGGFPLVVLVRALLMTGASTLTGCIAWRRTGRFLLSLGAALLSAAISYRFANDRPLLVTFLLVSVTIAILEYGKKLWVLPPLFLLWANCHGGFFMGWVVLACYVADAWIQKAPVMPERARGRLSLVAAVSVLASGLNPNGFRVIQILQNYRVSYMQSMLAEWHSTPLLQPSPFVVIAVIATVVLFRARKTARPVDWLLFAVFAFAGIYALRNVVFMAIVGPMVIAANLPWKERLLPAWMEYVAAIIVAAAILLPIQAKRAFQFSAFEAVRPAGAATFLLNHHITGTLFNTYEEGGYLIWRLWPQNRVFVDGRALNEQAFRDYRQITYGGQNASLQLLDQYGAEVILVNGYEYFTGGLHLLVPELADPRQTTWKLVYRDDEGMVFLRNVPPGMQVLNNSEALSAMEAQCAAHVEAVPEEPVCARETCKLFEHLGNLERARYWMSYYLAHKIQPDPQAQAEYQRLIAGGG